MRNETTIFSVIQTKFSKLPFFTVIRHSDVVIAGGALRAIGNIASGNTLQTQVVLNCSVLPPLLKLLDSGTESIRRNVCWTLSNIAGGDRVHLQVGIP